MSIPVYAPESTMVCKAISSGRNSVRAFAVSDMSQGAVCAGHGSGSPGGGTSVILEVDADMPMTSMVRAAITSMEAVTCVLQDLDVRDSEGNVCSGCSNLSIAVIRNRGSGTYLRGAGKHSVLGQVIGESVYQAVRESALANGLSTPSRWGAISRLERAGADAMEMMSSRGSVDTSSYLEELERLSSDEHIRAVAAAMVSISDAIRWGLLPEDEGMDMGRSMMGSALGMEIPLRDDLVSAMAEALAVRARSGVE
ncbi:adenosylcobinamide amidohydrolase [Candidatus Methanoprimaticola sp. MG2]|uniref:adenosylcobinamide amidohydrolase n=1 Tax=Candidatus Methanoprimaticola sp. MG2 TaxID=3228838 RepID=UPI0039C5CDCD